MENIIITTPDTTSLLPNSLATGWVAAGIATTTISILNYSAQVPTVNLYNSCNYNTFSGDGFLEFETKIVSDTGLLSDTYLPIGNYGINTSTAPIDVLTMISLTCEQKATISFSLSLQNKGYYVIVSVAKTSTTFTGCLKQYGIPFDTSENIKNKFGE
jgi:hypothetical protein